MTQNEQLTITRQLDAAWIISLYAAIHVGEPPDGWITDKTAIEAATVLAKRLSDIYGGEDNPETVARRLAGLGIGVEVAREGETVLISAIPDDFEKWREDSRTPKICFPPCNAPPCQKGCMSCRLFMRV
jgi:hypothetical protein